MPPCAIDFRRRFRCLIRRFWLRFRYYAALLFDAAVLPRRFAFRHCFIFHLMLLRWRVGQMLSRGAIESEQMSGYAWRYVAAVLMIRAADVDVTFIIWRNIVE